MDEEEEEEIQSQSQSPPPPPHALPHPNSRLSLAAAQPVTVAAAPPQHTLTLALPIQQSRPTGGGGGGGGGGGSGGGREDCWSDGATSTLIDAWGERYLELSRGNLKQKHWQDVADIVSSRQDYTKPAKTDVQCKNRIDTLKKKYKVEKAKIAQGQGPSNWPFFHTLDRLIGANTNITAPLPLPIPTAIPCPLPPPGTKVPVGIPVGITTFPNTSQHRQHPHSLHQHQYQHQQRKQVSRKKPPPGCVESGSTGSDAAGASPDSSDSFPPQTFNRKRPRIEKEMNSEQTKSKRQSSGKSNWGNSISELTRAILEFGECYERAETSKLQQMVEMEKQRIGFAKDLELQRMQFFMKTQLELSQLKHGRRRVGSTDHHHNNSNNRNHSD